MQIATLFEGIDPRVRTATKAERRYLSILNQARPLGLTRVLNGYSGPAGFVPRRAGILMKTAGWARLDYSGRNLRLKITSLGREEIGERPA